MINSSCLPYLCLQELDYDFVHLSDQMKAIKHTLADTYIALLSA